MHTVARWIAAIVGNAIGFLLADYLVVGFGVTKDPKQLFILTLVFAALNFVLKPVLKMVLGPIIVLTLGLALVAINAFVLYILPKFAAGLTIENTPALVYASLIISVVNFVFHLATKKK